MRAALSSHVTMLTAWLSQSNMSNQCRSPSAFFASVKVTTPVFFFGMKDDIVVWTYFKDNRLVQ